MDAEIGAADLTQTLGGTKEGALVGTVAYVSPEQAMGDRVDGRSDIWAFGCLLYEMLTAKRAFPGVAVADTLGAVMRGEPDWTALPAGTPPPLRTLLRRCLEKDRARRLADIGDARLEVDDLLTGRTEPTAERHHPPPAPVARSKPHRGRSIVIAAFVAGVIFAAVIARVALDRQTDAEPQVVAPAATVNPRSRLARHCTGGAVEYREFVTVEFHRLSRAALYQSSGRREMGACDGRQRAEYDPCDVTEWPAARLQRTDRRRQGALASIPYVRRRMAAAGNGRCYLAVLVARQHVHRIFCRSHVEAAGSGRPRHTHARREPDFFADHSDASGEPARRHMGS